MTGQEIAGEVGSETLGWIGTAHDGILSPQGYLESLSEPNRGSSIDDWREWAEALLGFAYYEVMNAVDLDLNAPDAGAEVERLADLWANAAEAWRLSKEAQRWLPPQG